MPIREPARHKDKSTFIDRQAMRLGDMLRWNMRLYFNCDSCFHTALADVGAIGNKLGYDRTVPEVAARARCTKCGSAKVSPIVKSERESRPG